MEEPHAFFAVVLIGSFLSLPSGGGWGWSQIIRTNVLLLFMLYVLFYNIWLVQNSTEESCWVVSCLDEIWMRSIGRVHG